MKVYSVSYDAELDGSWLTWFINQHKGFQNYNLNDRLTWNYEQFTWADTVKNNQWNDKSNIVYELSPYRNWTSIHNSDPHKDDELLRLSNTIGIIVPYVDEVLKLEFVKHNTLKLNTSVERSVLNIDYSRIACTSSDESVNTYSKYSNLYRMTTIDMGKLLNCHSSEYHQLLKSMHCDELPEWKQLCAEYKASVFPS